MYCKNGKNIIVKFNVQETFQSTLQGEGYNSGRVCDFIRLYGCPVGCYFCDTGYASPNGEYYLKKLPKLVKTEKELLSELKSKFIVISGGEPFIHKQLPDLCKYLINNGKNVAIETSGCYWKEVPDKAFITLSPKEHLNSQFPVLDKLWQRSNELKIVVSKLEDFDFYKEKALKFKGYKYLQPEHSEFKDSIQITLNLLQNNDDFKLSLQTHKILNIQ